MNRVQLLTQVLEDDITLNQTEGQIVPPHYYLSAHPALGSFLLPYLIMFHVIEKFSPAGLLWTSTMSNQRASRRLFDPNT